jgi:hypothetical protein
MKWRRAAGRLDELATDHIQLADQELELAAMPQLLEEGIRLGTRLTTLLWIVAPPDWRPSRAASRPRFAREPLTGWRGERSSSRGL